MGQLQLVDRFYPGQQPLRINFSDAKLKHRVLRGGKKELLLRATNAKPGLRVADWTAGLGTDSLLLAAAGCEVQMFERSSVLVLLLRQAIAAAKQDPDMQDFAGRMTLVHGDARGSDQVAVDVIYLDPMFPARGKSALVNGPMQYLQRFVGPDGDAEHLVARALASSVKRVVVKRPVTAPESRATFVLAAKANRFDVYERPGVDCS